MRERGIERGEGEGWKERGNVEREGERGRGMRVGIRMDREREGRWW